MTMKTLSLILTISLLLTSHPTKTAQHTRDQDGLDAFAKGALVVGTVAAVGGLLCYACKSYSEYSDAKLLRTVEDITAKGTYEAGHLQSLATINNSQALDQLYDISSLSNSYKNTLKRDVTHVDRLYREAKDYLDELHARKNRYSYQSSYFKDALPLEELLRQTVMLLAVQHIKLNAATTLLTIIEHMQAIKELMHCLGHMYQHELDAMHIHSPFALKEVLDGQDNLKYYWLRLDDSIAKLSKHMDQLIRHQQELSSTLQGASSYDLPYALRSSYQHHEARLGNIINQLSKLIKDLQMVQYEAVRHPRYPYDDARYTNDLNRKLTQENQELTRKMHRLQDRIDRLEQEKSSLMWEISSLRSTMHSLRQELAERPAQQTTIVIQS